MLARISLGPHPWLHPLLLWLPNFVHGLHSYYDGYYDGDRREVNLSFAEVEGCGV